MSKKILMISVLFFSILTYSHAQWQKNDDPNLDLRTIVKYKYDTGIILGNSIKQGVVISKDGGLTFEKFKSSVVPNAYYFENDTIYIGGYYNKVQYTTDFGLTFKDITTADIKDQGVNCFAKYDNNFILVGTIRNGIYSYNKTTNQWLNIGHKNKEIDAILVNGQSIYAAVRYQDVSKTNDLGTTWKSLFFTNNNPATDLINYKGNLIMSTIGTGIKISYNNGDTWESMNSGISGVTNTGNSLAISKDGNHLFMVGFGEGVYYFNDKLKIWEDISKDLPSSNRGEDLAILGNKIFTDVFPVQFDNTSFIYSLNFEGIISSSNDLTSNNVEIELYPNPSQNVLNILVNHAENVKNNLNFVIYDSNFKEIIKYNSENSNLISIDIESLPKGNYILQTNLNFNNYYSIFTKL